MFAKVMLYLWDRRTTALGYLGIILGVLAGANGLISDVGVRWIVLLNGIVTAVLGHYNNSRNKPEKVEEQKA